MQTFLEFLSVREAAGLAFCRGEPGPAVALSSTNEPASFFGPYGQIIHGAENVRKCYADSAGSFGPKSESRIEIIHAAESADIAHWSGFQRATVDLDGRLIPLELRITELFRRENDAWKLVHRHADLIQPKK